MVSTIWPLSNSITVLGKGFHHGTENSAGATPFGPEIDEYRGIGFQDLVREVAVRDGYRVRC